MCLHRKQPVKSSLSCLLACLLFGTTPQPPLPLLQTASRIDYYRLSWTSTRPRYAHPKRACRPEGLGPKRLPIYIPRTSPSPPPPGLDSTTRTQRAASLSPAPHHSRGNTAGARARPRARLRSLQAPRRRLSRRQGPAPRRRPAREVLEPAVVEEVVCCRKT
jgi:hypothetical protein